MLTMTNILINFSAIVHWILRFFVAWSDYSMKESFIQPYNFTIEIVLLFASLVFIVGIIKGKLWAAILYFTSYALYLGIPLLEFIISNASNGFWNTLISNYNMLASIIGIVIAFLPFMYILANIGRDGNKKMKDMEWFFKKGNYERVYDERADRNQYKIK